MKSYEPLTTFGYVEFTHPTVTSGYERIKKVAEEMEDTIKGSVSSPRHVALAMTRLEEAIAWANKGLRYDQEEINRITEGNKGLGSTDSL
jgi:hypothetical protein